mmetsp:Transcript_55210/g.120378  ORF Transcript_55210/g.120378 Transcript_55210/m.120378 type:complete len:225 (-) Transcript_55210:2191-2865(-)
MHKKRISRRIGSCAVCIADIALRSEESMRHECREEYFRTFAIDLAVRTRASRFAETAALCRRNDSSQRKTDSVRNSLDSPRHAAASAGDQKSPRLARRDRGAGKRPPSRPQSAPPGAFGPSRCRRTGKWCRWSCCRRQRKPLPPRATQARSQSPAPQSRRVRPCRAPLSARCKRPWPRSLPPRRACRARGRPRRPCAAWPRLPGSPSAPQTPLPPTGQRRGQRA